MKLPKFRWTLALGGEIALAIGLCVVSYGLFLSLLGVIFPSSTGLRDLINAAAGGSSEAAAETGTHALSGSGMVADVEESPAVLEVLSPKVMRKPADGVAWVSASSGARLHGRDGVQTASRGAARIDFDRDNRLQLGPSTLVVIRESVEEVDRPARQASVLMLEGELWADVASGAGGHAMTLQVRTPSGVARVAPASESSARMRVAVNRDHASTFSVLAGEATIHTREGAVRVGANQAVAVDSSGEASAPRPLPAAPALVGPPNGARVTYRDMVPAVTFAWREVPGASGYRFELARDAAFQKVVERAATSEPAFRRQGLGAGAYFWRVSAVSEGAEGAPGPAYALRVERQAAGAPRLEIKRPPSIVHGDRYVIAGVASPSAQVRVAGEVVRVDRHGRFRHEVVLQPGMNMIVIEAAGADGTTAYQSAIINAKP